MSESTLPGNSFFSLKWIVPIIGLALLLSLGLQWIDRDNESLPGGITGDNPAPPPSLAPRINQQVVVIGVDAANWARLYPLLEEGKLPNIARLMEHGSYGHLETLQPTISPMIWTSVATGKSPDKHGINDFTAWDETLQQQVPATGKLRKTLAVWNILSHYGLRSGVVNWWTTWPAEPINGFVLTGLAAKGRRLELEKKSSLDSRADSGGYFYPPELSEKESSLGLNNLSLEDLGRVANLKPEDLRQFETIQSYQAGNPFSVLKYSLLGDHYYEKMTDAAMDLCGRPDLLLYYTSSTDALGHALYKYNSPSGFPQVDSSMEDRFSETIDLYYQWVDELLGRVLSNYEPDTNVVLISDHGMIGMPDVTRPGVRASISGRHTDHALIIASGRDFLPKKVFPTYRVEGENFEKWSGSVNYQELGIRNLYPNGWMKTPIITEEGKTELRVDYEIQAEEPLFLKVLLDGEEIGWLDGRRNSMTFEAEEGLHWLTLECIPKKALSKPIHPPQLPWTALMLHHGRPETYRPGEDWGYFLWEDREGWHLRWTAYQGKLWEMEPEFSGRIFSEKGFSQVKPVPADKDFVLDISDTAITYQSRYTHNGAEQGLDFIPKSPVTFDLLIDGARYPRMVNIGPVARVRVDAVVLEPIGWGKRPPQASVMDITPNVLALFGLPPAQDMDGRLWNEHLKPDVVQSVERLVVPTYETLGRVAVDQGTGLSAAMQGQMDYLEAMGYVGGGPSPAETTPIPSSSGE